MEGVGVLSLSLSLSECCALTGLVLAAVLPVRGMAQELLISHRTVSAQAHQAIIETIRQVTDSGGQSVLVTNTYVELATGLNRWDARTGEWVPASDTIETFDEGFLARQSAHQVLWPKTLDAAAVVDVQDAEGQRYRSRVLGLSWFDAASGESVLIAEVQSSEGKLVTPNTVLYADAFDGVQADLAYVNRRDGLAQEVVLREALPGPEFWGLDPDSSRLEVITEFVEAPAFTKRDRVLRSVAQDAERGTWAAPDLVDAEVGFGAYRLGPGRAFALGEEDDLGAGTAVAKRWEELEGRSVLLEQVEWRQVKDEIGRLPRQAQANANDGRLPRTASVKRQLPARPVAVVMDFNWTDETPWTADSTGSAKQAAMLPLALEGSQGLVAFAPPSDGMEGGIPRRPDQLPTSDFGLRASRAGYVLDYELVTSQADFTFKGDTTYYVSGTVILTGTTTLEGGAVVKFAPMMVPILVRGDFVCRTALYRPAIFTARDDDTVGAVIAGGTGTVGSGYYGVFHLYFQTDGPVDVRNVRCTHALYGLGFHGYYGNYTHLVRHVQLIDCLRPVMAMGTMTLKVQNALIAQVKANGAAFYGNNYATVEGQHLTVAGSPNLYLYQTPANFTLYNSLLAYVEHIQEYTDPADEQGTTSGNRELPESEPYNAGEEIPPVFQSVGGGGYYISAERLDPDNGGYSLYQTGWPANWEEGWTPTGVDPDLLAELERMTPVPPTEKSSSVTADEVWAPRTLGHMFWPWDMPHAGYHYPILDYLVNDLTIQGATLTLTNGVAVGVSPSSGFVLASGSRLVSQGKPVDLNRLVPTVLVQESAESGGNLASLISDQLAGGAVPELSLRFTEAAVPASGGSLFTTGLQTEHLAIRDCEIYGCHLSCWGDADSTRVFELSNNLWARANLSIGNGLDTDLTAHAHNNTFWRSSVSPNMATGGAWEWRDNLFDHADIWQYYAYVPNSHNGYYGSGSGYPRLQDSAGNDVFPTTLDYLQDEWGRGWYPVPDTGQLTDTGSRSAEDAGLYFHTIEAAHPHAPEGTTQVDIGYHQSALVRPVAVISSPETPGSGPSAPSPTYVDYHPGEQALIVSVNFPSGSPNNFTEVKRQNDEWTTEPWSSAAGHLWDIEHMVVQNASWALPQGTTLFGGRTVSAPLYPAIRSISPTGTYDPNPWVVINDDVGDKNLWPLGFAVDSTTTGAWGQNLLVTTGLGNLWLTEATAISGRIVRIDCYSKYIESVISDGHYREGLIVLPDLPQYGPDWAGHVLTRAQEGEEWRTCASGILRISPDAIYPPPPPPAPQIAFYPRSAHFLGLVDPLDFALLESPAVSQPLYVVQNLITELAQQYGVDGNPAEIAAIPAGFFANLTGGDVVALQTGKKDIQAGPYPRIESAELFCLHWRTQGVSTEVTLSQITYRPLKTIQLFEGACFAPIPLPPNP